MPRSWQERVLSGKNIVYITVGDPYLYSTWIYMHRDLTENHPDMDISVIPGIVSIFTFCLEGRRKYCRGGREGCNNSIML